MNSQFQSLLDKYNISIPQDTKLSFTIDPNTLKATVTGTEDKALAKSIEDVINTADNAKQLFLHIVSSRSDGAELAKLARNGFDSVPDLVLSIDYQNGSFYDVKQSENFGTQKSGWIKELKQARRDEELAHKDEEYESQYLDTTQFTKKYNDIDLTSNTNNTKKDNKEVLTKDELMLKYLLSDNESEISK